MRLKTLLIVLSTLATALVVGGVTGPANAASGCPGGLIFSQQDSTHVIELDVYYDSSTGRNCAIGNHVGASYGKAAPTQVLLFACTQTTPGPYCEFLGQPAADPAQSGYPWAVYKSYSYYAGPVSLAARGRCIYADAAIKWNGVTRWVATGDGATHCG